MYLFPSSGQEINKPNLLCPLEKDKLNYWLSVISTMWLSMNWWRHLEFIWFENVYVSIWNMDRPSWCAAIKDELGTMSDKVAVEY
jgi:hypothetical protein